MNKQKEQRMQLNKNNAGLQAEQIAETFLRKQGLKLIQKNYHCRFGEIDLVMQEGSTLVFCEVRLRNSHQFGGAAASITIPKQQKLVRAAQQYLQTHPSKLACRFDAVLLSANDLAHIEWIRNAFDA